MAAEAPPTPPGSPSRPRSRDPDASSREADALAASLAEAVRSLRVSESPPRAPRTAPILLVLDVNGLLLDRHRSAPAPGGPRPDLVYSAPGNGLRSYVYDRPHSRDFASWALQRFRVAVWSSAQMHNLRPLVAHVFGAAATQLAFVWGQEQCTRAGGSVPSRAGGDKPRFCKELRRVWEAGLGEPQATLLIDDDPYKAARNPPHTAVHPPAYAVAQRAADDGLAPHAPLRRMLQRLADARNVTVPEFVAANPLATHAARAS